MSRDITALSPFLSRGHRDYCSLIQLSLGAKAGYTLNKSPAHCRTLTDVRGSHARCQLHIRSNFGVQYLAQGYLNMQLSSAPGFQTGDLPITSNLPFLLSYSCP